MAIRHLVYFPDPRLYAPNEVITDFDNDLQIIINDMIETMYATNGIGLAAPQIGINKKLTVIDIKEPTNKIYCLINPEIVEQQGEALMQEGCLSLPGLWGKVRRAVQIKARALDRDGTPYEIHADGLLAHCIQHEIDHLNGKLLIDHFSSLKRSLAVKKFLKIQRKEK